MPAASSLATTELGTHKTAPVPAPVRAGGRAASQPASQPTNNSRNPLVNK